MKIPVYILLIVLAAAAIAVFAGVVQATSKDDIVYPVAELDGCKNEPACRAYCEVGTHILECVKFGEKHNLVTRGEAEDARKFSDVLTSGGLGGCRDEKSCRQYCEDIAHIDECLEVAEAHNLLPAEELAEAKQVAKALKEGASLPGACRSRAECESYCTAPAHINECIDFAEKAGFISPEEVAEARKFAPLIQNGQTPGKCASKEQCEAYCQDDTHFQECVDFALANNLLEPEEVELIRKAGGKGPGGCKSKAQCEAYCADPTNVEVCLNFAEQAGLITPEQAEIARSMGGKGPGGCKSTEECEAYCRDASHRDECLEIGLKAGMISEEEATFARTLGCGSQEECLELCQKPENQERCQMMLDQFHPVEAREREQGKQRGEEERHRLEREIRSQQEEKIRSQTESQIREQEETRIREETERQTVQQYCHLFEAAPDCSYAGAPDYEKMRSTIRKITSRSGPIIAVATDGDEEIAEDADDVIYIPCHDGPEIFNIFSEVAALQLFAYYTAEARGCDIDQPRNLAKSVTVE